MDRDGVISWRAGCAERCTSGSEGGPGKRTGRKPATAPRSDPYTYLRTWEGWLYLAAVQDAYSRRIVGWAMTEHMRTELVADALQMAVARRRPGPGLIHHSDQGSQYVALGFGQQARDAGIAVSMGSKGDAYDCDDAWAALLV
jgi:putative transposase